MMSDDTIDDQGGAQDLSAVGDDIYAEHDAAGYDDDDDVSEPAEAAEYDLGDVTFNAPTPGDHVICLHFKWAYYAATVVDFDPEKFIYTVDWDDGDPTGRETSYEVREC